MKKMLVGIMLLSVVALPFVQASSTEVPSVVMKAFQQKFPDVENVKWSKTDALFVAGFFQEDGQYKKASFDQAGRWMMTKTEIDESDLPDSVLDYISSNYEADYFDSAYIIEKSDTSYYSVSIETEEGLVVLQLDEDGDLVED